MRFGVRDSKDCPDQEHEVCFGLTVTIIFENLEDQNRVERFAQQLRGRWQSHVWGLHLTFWLSGTHTIGQEVPPREVETTESEVRTGKVYGTTHCRSLVIYVASDNGSVSTDLDNASLLKLIDGGMGRFPFTMAPARDHALLVFVGHSVPHTASFVSSFQDAVNSEQCPFKNVVLYSTRDLHPVRAAFGPAVTAILSCWGDRRPLFDSVKDAWLIDRWAEDIVVTVGAKQEAATLHFRLKFATYGWETQSRLELCECEWTGGPYQEPKAWEFVKTNKPGAATTATVRCSWCKSQVLLEKPANVPKPSYKHGTWFREVRAVATRTRTHDAQTFIRRRRDGRAAIQG
ncbi:hypothetical protein FRC12_004425 [Ceratobasidium sp. 428]|nr:hypothetical protein FRC12_004425 [Ceratobasidium sp. 428]